MKESVKIPITIMSNDWHISPSTIETVTSVIMQKIDLCKKLGVKQVIVGGDIFQSRQSQPLSVLKCFENILDEFNKEGIKVNAIPGNHDKTNYDSQDSFLDSFTHHPSMRLVKQGVILDMKGVKIRMIPFISDNIFISALNKSFEQYPVEEKEILVSHIAVNGSINNDGTKVTGSISPSILKPFTTVLLGHYHNYHKVSGEIYHTPSIYQKDFGEDVNKGFTVIYDDCSFEIVNSEFKKFETVELDLDKLTSKEFREQVKSLDSDSNNIRLKIKGSEEKIKSIKIDELKMSGFFVKTEQKDIIDSINQVESGNIVEHTSSTIIDEFFKFCEKEEYEGIEIGEIYLKKKLNGQ